MQQLRFRYKDKIVVNPLMRGGIVPEEVQEELCREKWLSIGYALCFDCIEGRSSLITKPNVKKHLENIASFFNGDVAEHTFGCRAAQFAVMHFISRHRVKEEKTSNIVIADPNSHYSTNIAAEACELKIVEVMHSGYPEYKVSAESYAEKIEELKSEGKTPALVVATHADPYYGNLAPVKEIGKICEDYEVPFLVNAAYTGGVMEIDMKEIKADFLTLSAHKSMASLAPLGYLVTTFEYSRKLFELSKEKADWSGRAFGKKIPNLFGCSVGGLPLLSSMLSFEHVKSRVKNWSNEVAKINRFIDDFENLGEIMLLGERPHKHHLMHFETPVLWEISKNHKRKGFFLAEELEKLGIVGVHKGLTKHIKMSIYGLSDDEVKAVIDAFEEIIKKHAK